jgi:hypothetical protein
MRGKRGIIGPCGVQLFARGGGVEIAPVQKIGADKFVEVAVENFVHIAALDFGADVFNQLVGLERVGADLAAEADFWFGGVELA